MFSFFVCLFALGLHCRTGFLQMWGAGATLHCGAQASHCGGFSCCGHRLQARGLQQLWRMGSVVVGRGLWSAGSVVVAHGLSCSAACGIFPDQGSNPCPLHWQADSQPLHHQGNPSCLVFLTCVHTHTHTHTHTHSHIHTVGWGETFGGAGYVYYFDCFDSFTDECISPNSSNCVC